MALPLAFYGHPSLRKKAQPVETISPQIERLAARMIETMKLNIGCGLAAVQVMQDVRLIVVCPDAQYENGRFTGGNPAVYLNPRLYDPSEEAVAMDEGCLSIPGIRGTVIRPRSITLEALTLDGTTITKHLDGFEARVVMHENDHLNGVLFVDRLSDKERRFLDKALRDLKKKHAASFRR